MISGGVTSSDPLIAVFTVTVAVGVTVPPAPLAVNVYVVVAFGVTCCDPLAGTSPIPLMSVCTAPSELQLNWLESPQLISVGAAVIFPVVGPTAIVVVLTPERNRGRSPRGSAPFHASVFVAPVFTSSTVRLPASTVTGPDQIVLSPCTSVS